jgi:hypothetical protein
VLKVLKDLLVVKDFKVLKVNQLLAHQVLRVLKEILVTKVITLRVIPRVLKVHKEQQVPKELKDKVEDLVHKELKVLKVILDRQVEQVQSDHRLIQG